MKYDIDYGEAEIISEQENAVRLMSIHKSKGLEFPVVFVCGMGKSFNEQDLNSSMIFHPEFGIGLKWFDCGKRTKANTLIHQIFFHGSKAGKSGRGTACAVCGTDPCKGETDSGGKLQAAGGRAVYRI